MKTLTIFLLLAVASGQLLAVGPRKLEKLYNSGNYSTIVELCSKWERNHLPKRFVPRTQMVIWKPLITPAGRIFAFKALAQFGLWLTESSAKKRNQAIAALLPILNEYAEVESFNFILNEHHFDSLLVSTIEDKAARPDESILNRRLLDLVNVRLRAKAKRQSLNNVIQIASENFYINHQIVALERCRRFLKNQFDDTLIYVPNKILPELQYFDPSDSLIAQLRFEMFVYTALAVEIPVSDDYRKTDYPLVGVRPDTHCFNFTKQQVKLNQITQLDQLAYFLTENAISDYDKVQAIFNFIVKNITYKLGPAAAMSTFVNFEGQCAGQADLFNALARYAGVECYTVHGYADSELNYIRLMGDYAKHAWNLVVLDGHYYIIDPTWNEFLQSIDGAYAGHVIYDLIPNSKEKNRIPIFDHNKLRQYKLYVNTKHQ